ncbi:MAG: TrkA family potassium uptake protein [Endomicrobium sp.]|jgi:trk system potassium uptake protein TrkA|nr:TrkA family potassium uptake protein [Endomicrobium sp.]
MKKKQFGVVGLGTFGYNVAVELAKKGVQVLALDNDAEIVNKISELVTQALVVDATDEKAVLDAGIADCDSVVIAVGGIETSILATLIVKELKVKSVIVKCTSLWHSKVAAKLGADTVVYPEFEMAKKLVDGIITPNILEQIELSKDHSLAEIVVPKEFVGKTIRNSGIKSGYGLNIIAVRKQIPIVDDDGQTDIKEEVNMVPGADDEIHQGDVLVVVGSKDSLEKFKKVKEVK